MKLYVKKLSSLNPTKYKNISIDEAIKGYEEYVFMFINSKFTDLEDDKPKNFREWRTTEI